MSSNVITRAVKKESVLMLIILIGVAVAAPLLIKQQLVTGTIVNAVLIIAVSFLGVRDGLIIGLIPSTFALATGVLPAALAPMVPFIIVGNALLVLTFSFLHNFNFWVGVLVGGILKVAFLYGTSALVSGLLVNKLLAPAVARTMSWPQIVTVLAGGIVAFGALKLLKFRTSSSGT